MILSHQSLNILKYIAVIIIATIALYIMCSDFYWLGHMVQYGPIGDGWIENVHFIKILSGHGDIWNDWLWPHGEHRILTTRLGMYLDYIFDHGGNRIALIRAYMIIIFSIYVCWLAIFKMADNLDKPTKIFLSSIILIYFCFEPFKGAFVIPIHHVWPLLILFLVATSYCFANLLEIQTNYWLVLTILYCSLANWSFGQGVLIWEILLFFAIKQKLKTKYIITILGFAFINTSLYFYHWIPSKVASQFLYDPIAFFKYFINLAGLPITYQSPILGSIIGLVGIGLFFYTINIYILNIKSLKELFRLSKYKEIFLNKSQLDKFEIFTLIIFIISFIGLFLIASGRYNRPGDGLVIDGFFIPSQRFINQTMLYWISLIILFIYRFRQNFGKLLLCIISTSLWIILSIFPYNNTDKYGVMGFNINQNMLHIINALNVESQESIEFFERPGTYNSYINLYPKIKLMNIGGVAMWQTKFVDTNILTNNIYKFNHISTTNKISKEGICIKKCPEVIDIKIAKIFNNQNKHSVFISGNIIIPGNIKNPDSIFVTDTENKIIGFGLIEHSNSSLLDILINKNINMNIHLMSKISNNYKLWIISKSREEIFHLTTIYGENKNDK